VKFYWDTSAVINAVISTEVHGRLDKDDHVSRSHTFSEFFSVMTGRGIAVTDDTGELFDLVLRPSTAAKWLRSFAGNVTLIELDGPEILDALDKAESKRISGQGVFDYGHALAAAKANVDVILTRDTADFQRLGGAIKIEWP
jgi:predicted nucleic acid-binding protein